MPEKQKQDEEEEQQRNVRYIGLGVTVPTILGATVIVGCLIGYYLDKWLGTDPWMLLLFLILGIAAGVRETMIIVRKMYDGKR